MNSTIINKSTFQQSNKFREHLGFGITLICLFLFIISAYNKIADHERFLKGLSKVQIIGAYAGLISWAVPVAEIIVCLLLIIPKTQKLGLYGFAGMMVIFTIYIGSMLLWKDKLPCHCNLIVEQLSWGQHLWFNVAFIALSVSALWLGRAKEKYKIKT